MLRNDLRDDCEYTKLRNILVFFYRLLFQTPEFNDFTLGLRDEVDDVNRQIKVGVRCKWLYMFMPADQQFLTSRTTKFRS